MSDEIKIVQSEMIPEKSHYESQVDIARRYPRNIMKSVQNAIAIVTKDKETAETCHYVLPWNRKISGPSVHLAKIVVQCYGNIHGESGIVGNNATEVTAEGTCFDAETNTAYKSRVTKSIMDKYGKRFSDYMIVTTGMAAAAIAYRNAVFSVIPKSIIDKVHKSAIEKITGDLSDETKLIAKRDKYLKTFLDVYTVTEKEILTFMELNSVLQIKNEQILVMNGIAQSLKDKEFTVDELFLRKKNEEDKNPSALNTPETIKKDDK